MCKTCDFSCALRGAHGSCDVTVIGRIKTELKCRSSSATLISVSSGSKSRYKCEHLKGGRRPSRRSKPSLVLVHFPKAMMLLSFFLFLFLNPNSSLFQIELTKSYMTSTSAGYLSSRWFRSLTFFYS